MAKAKDDPERRRIVAQQKHFAQGALFIIDNAGPCPPNVDLLTFTNDAIERHLAHHTYYQQKNGFAGFENRVRVNATRMRLYLKKLGERSNKGKKSVSALFLATSEAIKADVKKSYDYDKNSFSEGDLPGYEEEEEEEEEEVEEGDATSSFSNPLSRGMAGTPPSHSPEVLLPGPSKRALEMLDDSQHRQSKRPRTKTLLADTDHQAEDREPTSQNTENEASRHWESVDSVELEAAMETSFDASTSNDGERSDMMGEQAGQHGTAAVLGDELPVQTGLPEAHEAGESYSSPVRPLEGQTQGTSGEMRLDEDQPGSSLPAFGTSTLDSPEIMTTPAQTDDVTRIGQTVISESAQATTSRNHNRQEDAQKMHRVDVKVLGEQLTAIYRDLNKAVRSLLGCIGDLGNQNCPLELEPSEHLSALYARCLGPDWAGAARGYNTWNAFKALQATTSLVSAFLYDNILMQQAYDPDVIQDIIKLLQVRGITGRAAQAVYDFPNREKDVFEAACNIAAEEARAALAQDTTDFELQLQAEAEGHTKALWHTLAPHFSNQLHFARVLRLSSGRSDDEIYAELLKVFEKDITALIYKLLYHKIQLVATGCEHSYIWPSNGDKVEENEMVEHDSQNHDPLVRITVFPGLSVNVPGSYRDPGDSIRSYIMTKPAPYANQRGLTPGGENSSQGTEAAHT